MPASNFIEARNFTFEPFPHPFHLDDVGDSGAMELAAFKTGLGEQYVIKRGNTYPENATNEFMYRKVG